MILTYRIPTYLLITAVLSVARAEEWEIGGAVGWAFTKDQNITRANTTVKVGSERAAAISFFVSTGSTVGWVAISITPSAWAI